MRKGIWIGPDDQYLIEAAKEMGLSFSAFAKRGMRELVRGREGMDSRAIAMEVANIMEERGLVAVQSAQLEPDARLKEAANKLLGG